MKRWMWLLCLALCLVLSGCSTLLTGEYVWVQTHNNPVSPGSNQNVSAANYQQLYNALAKLVEAGTEQATISVERYDRNALDGDVNKVVDAICSSHPIGAYAVDTITCTQGTSGGEMALAVEILYTHDKSEIRQIKKVANNDQAAQAIAVALRNCDTGIVLLVQSYEPADFVQIVETYALEHPEYVMENPQVTENVYPDSGESRVVELKFTYQTSRESLKDMQVDVEKWFKTAESFKGENWTEEERVTLLYTLLMETNEYTIQTSITPAYSLLRYGVGDSRAFATVYAAMCRQAGLECLTVSGTRDGEPWHWNIVLHDGVYYHVDLLRCHELGDYLEHGDADMTGYVWDYSAYPPCGQLPEEEIPE